MPKFHSVYCGTTVRLTKSNCPAKLPSGMLYTPLQVTSQQTAKLNFSLNILIPECDEQRRLGGHVP
jgi:hypothetical protein